MIEPDNPDNEEARLADMRILNILPEKRFDRITRIAQRLFDVPIALISLIDSNRQWLKSCVGLDLEEISRSISFCGHAILNEDVFVISDAMLDQRFADNPIVMGEPRIRFFAGQPLKTANSARLGTLCIMGRKPRQLTALDIDILRDLAAMAENELCSRDFEDGTAALRDSEERLRVIIDNVLDGIITISDKGVVETFNKAAEKVFGYAAAEVIGCNVNMLMPEPYHSEHDGYLHNYLSTGKKKVIGIGREVTGRRKNGETFPMDLAVSEMQMEDKRVFIGLVRDITERKQSEENLRKLSRAIEQSPVSVMITDAKGSIEYVNYKFTEVTGYSVQEAMGKNPRFIQSNLTPAEVYQSMWEALREGKEWRGKLQNRKKNGELFWEEMYISAIRDSEGRTTNYVAVKEDITERMQIERMKSEFISTVSHELRTPLTSIRGSLALIAGGVAGELPTAVKPMIDIAHKNSERLILLVNDILDMEKIEAGRMEFSIEPIMLMSLLEQSLESNRAYAEQFKVAYELESSVPEAVIRADSNRLLQVLANLLSNAAKFSHPGGKVKVAAGRHDEHIRISITDNGPGIPDEFRSRIFQKFTQADSSDTRNKGGTGLGLVITKAIVEQLGGSIGFESQPEVQTTFFVDLPEWRK